MAEIQDFDSEVGEIESVEKQQSEAVAAAPELPEKYRGKSIEDVVKMHRDAEDLIARQGREVGEVRKLADELIKSQLTPKAEVEKPKEIDFFENPQEAIRQQIENNPRVVAAEQYAKQAQAEQSRQRLAQIHPDVQQIVGDVGFQEWVKASKVRTQLFQQADNYDIEAAHELISTYKELRGVRQKVVTEADNTARDKTLKAAAVDTGGSGESSQKVFRRADLIRLKMRDPAKYESMSDEIMAAYQTGRVK
jgi:hypothetical protein